MPGHGVGDVIPFGGRDDHQGTRPVEETDHKHAITSCFAGSQHALVAVDLDEGVREG